MSGTGGGWYLSEATALFAREQRGEEGSVVSVPAAKRLLGRRRAQLESVRNLQPDLRRRRRRVVEATEAGLGSLLLPETARESIVVQDIRQVSLLLLLE